MQPSYTIQTEDQATAALIESELLASLRSELPQAQNTSLVLAIRDKQHAVIGGLTASTSYGWFLIKCLWVVPDLRGQGLGRALMQDAQARALKMGCHAAWLDTSHPRAMAFYESLGYEVFGKLANEAHHFPPTHCRWFMKKTL